MDIKSDIDEAIKLWRSASPFGKVLIAITLFLTLSSIASLSDAIFQWKGFILDGVEFYRSWIAAPFADLASRIGLSWSEADTDFLILCGITVMSTYRYMWFRCVHPQESSITFWFSVRWTAFLCAIYIFLGIYFSFLSADVSVWSFIVLLVGIIFVGFSLRGQNRIVFLSPIAASLMIVLVLGAVNAGLLREA